MSIDPIMREAIINAVENAGQSKNLSQKIMAWINALLSGNVEISNDEDSLRHLDLMYSEIFIDDFEE